VGEPGRRAGREMKSEEFRERREELNGWTVNVVSYRVGDRFYCTVDNVDPGARFARAEGASRDAAEAAAIEKATKYLKQTRRFPTA
jgi:hypothetical protein